MKHLAIRLQKEFLKNLDIIINYSFIENSSDLFTNYNFLDKDLNDFILTSKHLVHIEFQNKMDINNLLAGKRLHTIKVFDFFNNHDKEVKCKIFEQGFREYLMLNISNLEYYILNKNNHLMLEYYVLLNAVNAAELTSDKISWKNKDKIKNKLKI